MRRVIIWCAAIGGVMVLTGCATNQWAYPRSAGPNSALLFDRVPGTTFAADIGPRSSWPSAPAGVEVRESVYYSEVFEDRQGRSQNQDQTFHRRFTSRRTGFVVK
ncbi:MAG: hypothetical protein HOP29_15365 [Phycisphaerales bacterium]|nr:hypothetical protein [Phycisphaerales bacterium]